METNEIIFLTIIGICFIGVLVILGRLIRNFNKHLQSINCWPEEQEEPCEQLKDVPC